MFTWSPEDEGSGLQLLPNGIVSALLQNGVSKVSGIPLYTICHFSVGSQQFHV